MSEPKPETYFQVGDARDPRDADPVFTTEAEACKSALEMLDETILAVWRLWDYGGQSETIALFWEDTEWRS